MTNELDKDQEGSIRSRLLKECDAIQIALDASLRGFQYRRHVRGEAQARTAKQEIAGLLEMVREAAEALALPSPRMIAQQNEKNDAR